MAMLVPALILLVMAVSVVGRILKFPKRIHHGRSIVYVIVEMAGLLLVAGGFTGFLGSMLLSFGLGKHIPDSFEFPIDRTEKALRDAQGNAYVPLEGISRIQVYDRQGSFLRGWHYEAYGGSARMSLIGDTVVKVATSRKRQLFTYSTRGRLLKEDAGSPLEYEAFQGSSFSTIEKDTPLLLLPFASPFGSGLVAMFGALVLVWVESLEKKRKSRLQAA